MYREFVVPGDQEILEAIGEWPEAEEGSEARLLTLRGEGVERSSSLTTLSPDQ
ncbi:hypothetical protein OG985_18150 [Streptomyces sp. NBC_00289]|uniref:hypothetical protein n=1 Tax=Streptomyces sp. NBC_00289 TaxID=2975703 RepID=UPI00325576CD